MSRRTVEKRPLFHGNAVALAAHIRRPRDYYAPAVASSCLPVTGGLAEAESKGQSFDDLISYDFASTRVLGDFIDREKAIEFTRGNHAENDLPIKTVAECVVRGFKIHVPGKGGEATRRTFAADRLGIVMESAATRQQATEFRSLSVLIEGVSVDDYPLTISTDTDMFSQNETQEKLRRQYERSSSFRKRYASHFYPTNGSSNAGCLGGLFGGKTSIPEARGIIVATAVTVIKWDRKPAPGTEVKGNQLIIEGLGSIYFAEVVIERDLRRATLIRFQLGSPDGGDGAVGEVQTNNHVWPPK